MRKEHPLQKKIIAEGENQKLMFSSIREAERLGYDRRQIQRVLHGNAKTHRKMNWKTI